MLHCCHSYSFKIFPFVLSFHYCMLNPVSYINLTIFVNFFLIQFTYSNLITESYGHRFNNLYNFQCYISIFLFWHLFISLMVFIYFLQTPSNFHFITWIEYITISTAKLWTSSNLFCVISSVLFIIESSKIFLSYSLSVLPIGPLHWS